MEEPRTTDYLKARVVALSKELDRKNTLIAFYENNIEDSIPATRGNEKPHIKYPDCFQPITKN